MARTAAVFAGVPSSVVRVGEGVAVSDLSFLGHLGEHVRDCDLCGRRWLDGGVPVVMLDWAARKSRVGDIMKAVEAERKAG
jgi:hypothetical protein